MTPALVGGFFTTEPQGSRETLVLGMNCLHLHPPARKTDSIQDTCASSLILTRKVRDHSHFIIRKLKLRELLKPCSAHQDAAVECVCSVAQSCPALWDPHGPQPARLLCPWDSPGKDAGVGCHALLQGIFSTQGT